MTTEALSTVGTNTSTVLVPYPVSGDVISAMESYIEAIPDAGDQGIEGILEQINSAATAADLDSPWRAGGLGKYLDQRIIVYAVRKMPSDYASALPWFLVIDGAVADTGEKLSATTGSISVVAQLAKAYSLGQIPLTCIPRAAKKPTKDGYFPQHLEVPR